MQKKASNIFLLQRSSKKYGLVAKIYFKTNKYDLDSSDFRILNRLVNYCALSLFSNKIILAFKGYADVRFTEIHNQKLSEDRAQTVKSFVDGRLKPCSRYSSYKNAFGKTRSGSDLLEDRRVDIFMTEENIVKKIPPRMKFNWAVPIITKSDYPYQYWADNKDLLRPLIFKHYHPDYRVLWSKLDHLIELDEQLQTLNQDEYIWINPGDEEAIIKLIEKYFCENELNLVVYELHGQLPAKELAEDFAIIYRGQYPRAYMLMEEDFSKSDFKYLHEFLAWKFNLVDSHTRHEIK